MIKESLSWVNAQPTRRQLGRYLVAGISAVATDSLTYFLLVHWVLAYVGYDVAKFVSFLSGTVVAYTVNKFWTFESKDKSFSEAAAFLTLYILTLGLNVSVNRLVLQLTQQSLLAFLAASACSTVANFFGQKFWVFKETLPT